VQDCHGAALTHAQLGEPSSQVSSVCERCGFTRTDPVRRVELHSLQAMRFQHRLEQQALLHDMISVHIAQVAGKKRRTTAQPIPVAVVTPERCIFTQRTHSPSRRTTSSTWFHCCERIYRVSLTIGHAHNSRSRRVRRMRQDGRRVLIMHVHTIQDRTGCLLSC
jgi:hypothetical protein